MVSALALGLFVGGLARWAVPGPDPMPAWLTIFIGLTGSLVGGGVTIALTGYETRGDVFAVLIVSIATAALLVIGYRRFLQGRPVTGPDARRMPTKGFGIARLRQKLRGIGIDPDSIGTPGGPQRMADPKGDALQNLRELRDQGALTEEEYEKRKSDLER